MAELRYIQSSSTGQPRFSPVVGALPIQSLLFGIQLGIDTSNCFAMSVYGLAVQTPCGRYVTREWRHNRLILIDVTALIIPVNPWVFRIPVRPDGIRTGDLIVTSDPPDFSALYVSENKGDDGRIHGLDTGTSQFIHYVLPKNPFLNYYVKAVSLFDVARKGLLRV